MTDSLKTVTLAIMCQAHIMRTVDLQVSETLTDDEIMARAALWAESEAYRFTEWDVVSIDSEVEVNEVREVIVEGILK